MFTTGPAIPRPRIGLRRRIALGRDGAMDAYLAELDRLAAARRPTGSPWVRRAREHRLPPAVVGGSPA